MTTFQVAIRLLRLKYFNVDISQLCNYSHTINKSLDLMKYISKFDSAILCIVYRKPNMSISGVMNYIEIHS